MSLATLFQEVENAFRPTGVRLSETQDAYVVEALVAGVKPKEIEITLEKRALSIIGKSGCYSYSYLVPIEGIQIDEGGEITASAEDGILKVTMPKAKATKPLKITVK
ncbi:MAG: Hsp20/alpha crystallin family protein [Parachlamydiales bacterium]|nr:Hsp20/alpha crystallin family protein [Parachlamydiales bacterium]